MTVPPEGDYLTVPEIAADLRVSKMTVYRLVHDGDLEAIRVGRSIRVPRESYTEYKRRAHEYLRCAREQYITRPPGWPGPPAGSAPIDVDCRRGSRTGRGGGRVDAGGERT
jgi:excisionase family DNA binding protein